MDEVAKQNLPLGFNYAWSGLSLEEIRSGSQSAILFGLGLLFVYLTLSAQYESFVLPFIILAERSHGDAGRADRPVGARTAE